MSTLQMMNWLAVVGDLLISSSRDGEGKTWWTVEYTAYDYQGTRVIQEDNHYLGNAIERIYEQVDK